jgi:hypothetical protein
MPLWMRFSILIRILSQVTQKLENRNFYPLQCQFTWLYLSHQCHKMPNFQYFELHIEILRMVDKRDALQTPVQIG